MENTIFDVWKSISPSLADTILFAFCVSMFFWFRHSIKSTMSSVLDMIQANAVTVKTHLDMYTVTHEKCWTALADLVSELKKDKVWQREYDLQIANLNKDAEFRDSRIKDIDDRLKCVERNRRVENP
jgi:hypothetical protein